MMRGIRRLVTYAAVAGLLAAGAVGASLEVAHADNEVTSCDGAQAATTTAYKCTVATGTATAISDPSAITVSVSDDTSGYIEAVVINYTVDCTDNTHGELGTAGAPTEETPITLQLSLPMSADGTCSVSATVSSTSASSSTCPAISASSKPSPSPSPTASVCPDDFIAILSYTPAVSATPTPTPTSTSTSPSSGPPVHPVKGYSGTCVDDNGNSSANRAKVQIWRCSGTDQAQNWTYSNDEFVHNGKCMNDQGNGGSRSHVILWSCNGASNEKWSELVNGELKLQSHGGTLCLDDPRSSTKNGTQLIVYTCKDSANQKWSLP